MTARRLGIVLLVLGLVLNQYGFLHDLAWEKHDGAIYMGMKSYTAVLVGLLVMIGGYVLASRPARG